MSPHVSELEMSAQKLYMRDQSETGCIIGLLMQRQMRSITHTQKKKTRALLSGVINSRWGRWSLFEMKTILQRHRVCPSCLCQVFS